jgi:clan AA aspartic protease (TIGR02281 family)
MIQINIRVRNGLILADIPVWSVVKSEYLKAIMLIDTGASVTAFADYALKRLGCYNEEKKSSVRTAGGFVNVHVVKLPKVQLGNVEIEDVDVHAHTNLDDFHFDGIIGMNILEKFNFSINFDKKLLTLEERF